MGRPRILLIEDSPADVKLVQLCFRGLEVRPDMMAVSTAEAGLAYLRAHAHESDLIVLLDLNLPDKSGFEALRTIKSDPRLCTIPVIVMTSSGCPVDVETAYRARANAYVCKPERLEECDAFGEAVELFWGQAARFPPRPVSQAI